MAQPKVAIRLGTEGRQEVVSDFKAVGDAGDAAANRASRAFDKAASDFESAERRMAAASQKIAAIMPKSALQMQIEASSGSVATGGATERLPGASSLSSLQEGSARLSAAAFRELIAEQERYEASAQRLRAAIDPVGSAQQRFNSEMSGAKALIANGSITLDEYCAKLRMEKAALDEVTSANGRLGLSRGAFRDQIAEQERYESSAMRLRAAIDPAWAAQQHFNQEMAEARTLIANGSITLDEYCAKLRLERAALDEVTGAHGRIGVSQGAMRSGLQQAGFQVQDFFVQVNGGTDALRAFSMQAPQLIGNLQMMTYGAEAGAGRFATFARLLGGPWGVALGVAIPAAALLAEKLMGDAEASKAAEEATKKHRNAVEALNREMRQSIQTAEDKARANYIFLESERLATIQTEKRLQAELATAKAAAERKAADVKMSARGDLINPGYVAAMREVERLEAALAKSRDAVAEQETAATTAMGLYQRTIIDQMSSPAGRVKRDYDQRINDAVGRGDAEAIAKLTRARDDELKKIAESEKALRAGTQALTQFILPVEGKITSGFGARTPPKPGASSFHPAIDIAAPVGTAVKAPQIGVVEALGYSESLGKFVVINHGGGTKTRYGHLSDNSIVAKGDTVQQGEVIARTGNTGRSTGPHLDYQVMVNGKAVDPRKGLFPTDGAGVEITKSVRSAAEAQRDLESSLASLQQRFDPVAEAARRYREQIDQIDALREKKLITDDQAADWKAQARASAFLPGFLDAVKPEADSERKKAEDDTRLNEAVEGERSRLSAGTALLQLEWQLRGRNRDEAERLLEVERYRLDIMRQYPALTADQVNELVKAKEAQDELNRMIEEYRRQQEEFQRLGENAIDRLFDPTSAESWGDRVKGVLSDILAEMFRMAALNPLKNLLFGSGLTTSGGGGFFGSLVSGLVGSIGGGGLGGVSASSMSYLNGVASQLGTPRALIGSAIGNEYTPAGAMLVGENGAEIVNMPQGAKVMTASDTRRAMAGTGQSMTYAPVYQIDATGADQAALSRVEAKLDEIDRNFSSRTLNTVQEANDRLYLRFGG